MNRQEDMKERVSAGLVARLCMGGGLMGLANLVPGISGGTMLVATGVYQRFIDAIAEVTSLRLSVRAVVTLGVIVASAGVAIVGLSGVIEYLIGDHRWVMLSVFIGLTLGGVPLVWAMGRAACVKEGRQRVGGRFWAGAAVGFVGMSALAVAQMAGSGTGGNGGDGMVMYFVAGVAGASAMILPGISGAYLLMALGVYAGVIGSIKRVGQGAAGGNVEAVLGEMGVVVPIGVGVVVGVVVVSHVLRFVLHRYERATLGVLMGLLVGAVVGLWPFQRPIEPVVGETVIKGEVVTEENKGEFVRAEWPVEVFEPTAMHMAGGAGLVVVGFAVTLGISRVGGRKGKKKH